MSATSQSTNKTMAVASDEAILELFWCLVIDARRTIAAIYNADIEVIEQSDAPLVTQANKVSENVIIASVCAQYFIMSPVYRKNRSRKASCQPISGSLFVLIEPLDGINGFAKHRTDLTINIVLIQDDVPVVGIVYVPVRRSLLVDRQGGGHSR